MKKENCVITEEEIRSLDNEYAAELLNLMESCGMDLETRHIEEDRMLTELLRKLGFEKTVEQYESTEKWYA